jgi:SAM-dependent methyltransferase
MSNVNDNFFDGHYKDVWRQIIPEELTQKEVAFMISYFNLTPESRVLDLMCGYGRHALALARKGIYVTAVDNLPDYVTEIQDQVEKEKLPVRVIQSGILEFKPDGLFDLIIFMGNSLNFFNGADFAEIIKMAGQHLNVRGQLLINTWSMAEIIIRNYSEKSWSIVGDFKILTDSKLLFSPTRLETESIIIAPDGSLESKIGIDYVFSMNEIEAALKDASLTLFETYSIPGKKRFKLGEPRAYLIAKNARM